MTDRKNQLRTEIMNRLLEASESLRAAGSRLGDHDYEGLSIDRNSVPRNNASGQQSDSEGFWCDDHYGRPSRNLVGPIQSQIHQGPQDVQFWKCVHAGKVYNVFRPIDPLASPAAIPIIRAQIGGREVYPFPLLDMDLASFRILVWI